MRFNDMPIADGTKDAVAAMGYEEATPIQRDAIPHLMAGSDLIGKAQTGTGKTAAFGVPIVDSLRDRREDDVLGLVLVPTRELALQVTSVLTDIAKGTRLAMVPIFGGTGFDKQTRALNARGPKIVVACPGRLLDLQGRGQIDLDGIRELVIDEADRMLDMGFIHDMRKILRVLPKKRRTSLWSATISSEVKALAKDFLVDPVTVEVEAPTTATELTEQFHVRVEKTAKTDALLTILATETPQRAVVFTRTKHLAKRLADRLDKHGWASVALQGNMSQGQRERAMDAFRSGQARILVATDVASRGLDVPDVTHVFNFDIPMEKEAYVHRIGRTGRNGRTGRSFTFVQSDEHQDWRAIEKLAGTTVPRVEVSGDATEGPDAPLRDRMPNPQGNGSGSRNGGGRARPHGEGHRRDPDGGRDHDRPSGGRSGTRRGSGGRSGGSGGSGGRSGGRPGGSGRSSGGGRSAPRQTAGAPGRSSGGHSGGPGRSGGSGGRSGGRSGSGRGRSSGGYGGRSGSSGGRASGSSGGRHSSY